MNTKKLIGIIAGLVSGLLFGAGMIISGMADPKVVTAFLDLTGEWDPSLIFVMGGALLVFTPCYHLIIKKRQRALSGNTFQWPSNTKVDSTLIAGSVIFGLGWGISGICPGPAMSSIGGGSSTILAFVLSMLVGIVHANQYLLGRFPLPFVGYRKTREQDVPATATQPLKVTE
ncbi:YeeE/YedE family protein [Vibrio sp. ZSDE26]|uniref:YeeE/YedE family protein n=1 Tax=Vibrio amylolyticus TaxID=2847292 RepID=A0A9X1XMG8_9VIBR|nr:YeeE/YedE family protein [Vibrio amylolyticus]MCK6263635.1 YeeE/YedE family protein [Vibrio amylolyticus]